MLKTYIHVWALNNWRTADGTPVQHYDLWTELYGLLIHRPPLTIQSSHVYSHHKRGRCVANDQVDRLAGYAARNIKYTCFHALLNEHRGGG